MPSKSAQMRIDNAVDPEEWVDRYGDYLYGFAVSRLRNETAAEEVVQETFLAGITALHQFAGQGSQRGWLMGILRRKVIDYMRDRSKHQHVKSLDQEYDPTAHLFDENGRWKDGALPVIHSEQMIESDELWQIVKECLSRIPTRQADVFVLSVVEGMDNEKICQQLEISVTSLWTRLHRARLGLAKCVGSKWFVGAGGRKHE